LRTRDIGVTLTRPRDHSESPAYPERAQGRQPRARQCPVSGGSGPDHAHDHRLRQGHSRESPWLRSVSTLRAFPIPPTSYS